ncbi:MAG: hypothetical protein EOP86_18175 [Verrucomicrobiaceae bacterium]|nr:MAG: hypothetical protein EOP86_18175 [Verrucomicrobiaceae bacterium]
MRTLLKLTLTLPALLISATSAPLHAQTPAAATPTKSARLLDSLPEPVRASVVKAANGGHADEVKIIQSSGDSGKIYVVEIELGDDRDLDLRVAANGEILKCTEEVALNSAPEAVRTALEKLAGTTARIEDVKKVTKGQEVTWQAELDRKDAPDTKIRLDAQGAVLEKTEEPD